MDGVVVLVVLLAATASFAVSAAAGFGGSLILVPALALALGTKAGVALAALLLAGNNVAKVVLYRKTMPYRASMTVILCVALGSAFGARLLVAVPEGIVTASVIMAFAASFLAERFWQARGHRVKAPVLACASGMSSGFSGTSGPLKGVAVRALRLDRFHLVGALSLASLVGDITKATIFSEAGLISTTGYLLAVVATPLMLGASVSGRRLNRRVGERGFAMLFWAIMICYTGRLLLS